MKEKEEGKRFFIWIGISRGPNLFRWLDLKGMSSRIHLRMPNNDILVATKQEAELLRLEEKIEAEKDARIRLRESSDVVVECIKALQRKLQNETQLRESFVQNSQIEKTAQNKKIDG